MLHGNSNSRLVLVIRVSYKC